MRTRILIADDRTMFRDGLKALINRQADMEVVGEAENGQKAVEMVREFLPYVSLMDVNMRVIVVS